MESSPHEVMSYEMPSSMIQGDSQSLMFGSVIGMIGSPGSIFRSNPLDFSDARLDMDEDDLFSSSLPGPPASSAAEVVNSNKTRRRKASQPQRLVYCDSNLNNGVITADNREVSADNMMYPPAQEVQELHSVQINEDVTVGQTNIMPNTAVNGNTSLETKPVTEALKSRFYSCSVCQVSFSDRKSLRSHLQSHEDPGSCSKRRQKSLCNLCGLSLFNKTALKNHVKRIHEKPVREFKCNICSKEFVSKSELTQHSFVHSQDKNFVCDVCGKKFASKPYLERHVKTHTGDKPTFTCEVCGKQLTDKTGFVAHVRAHSGEKPYECTVCGNTYTIKRHLTSHSRIHSEVRPFACDVEGCGKTFRSRSNLRMHRDFHAGIKRWSCSFCSRSFLSQGNMAKHVRRHLGEKKYPCSLCPKAFIEKQELKSHMKVHSTSDSQVGLTTRRRRTVSATSVSDSDRNDTPERKVSRNEQEVAVSVSSCDSLTTLVNRSSSFSSSHGVDEEVQSFLTPARDNSPCEVTSSLEACFSDNRHPSSSSESPHKLDDMVVITLIHDPQSTQNQDLIRNEMNNCALLDHQSQVVGSSSAGTDSMSYSEGSFVSSSMTTTNSTSTETGKLPSLGFPYHISDQVFNCTLCTNYYPEAPMLRLHLLQYHRVDPDKIH